MLDTADFAPNPAAPELGGLGTCHVRYGKAMRGSPPRRRAVATVMPWTAEALAQYIEEVRPGFRAGRHPALWLTERGGRISLRQVDDRFEGHWPLRGDPPSLDQLLTGDRTAEEWRNAWHQGAADLGAPEAAQPATPLCDSVLDDYPGKTG